MRAIRLVQCTVNGTGRLCEIDPKFGQLEQEGGRTHLQGMRPLQTSGMGLSIRHPLPTAPPLQDQDLGLPLTNKMGQRQTRA